MLVAIISDTHLPRGSRALPAACLARLRDADAILHAGDVATAAVLDELEAIGPPLHAVCGNVDEPALRARLPQTRTVELGGVHVAMIHDAGAAAGRLERMRRRFPAADAVVFGHSHIPLHEHDAATLPKATRNAELARHEHDEPARHGFQIFNPGSPTDRRSQPRHTMGVARVDGDAIGFELIALD